MSKAMFTLPPASIDLADMTDKAVLSFLGDVMTAAFDGDCTVPTYRLAREIVDCLEFADDLRIEVIRELLDRHTNEVIDIVNSREAQS